MRYIVKKIQEPDYGCEEHPDDYVMMDKVLLRDESGQEIEFDIADDELYQKNINEGDWVVFDLNQQIFREDPPAEQFYADMKHIRKITIEYGGFFGGAERRSLSHDKEKIIVERQFFNGACDLGELLYIDKTWSRLLAELSKLHIENWKKEYVDPNTVDGTQWSLEIEYESDINSRYYYGSNMYPHNFKRLLKILEMER